MDKSLDIELNLPVPSLTPGQDVLEIIAKSRVNTFIGSIILKAHEQKVRKISVLSWDSEEATRLTAQILTAAFSLQIDRKCALVQVEGIRCNCEFFDTFCRVTIPELGDPIISQKAENFVENMDRIFPFHILIGPTIKNWGNELGSRESIVLNTDAQILLIPQEGFTRAVAKQIETFTNTHQLNWLGSISFPEGVKV